MALRLAGVAALATGGIALGRGVVTLTSARNSVIEVAGATARPGDPLTVEAAVASVEGDRQPAFTSSLRSWMVPLPAATAPTVAAGAPAPVSRIETVPAGAYIVAEGDTLSDIAERYSVEVDALARANQLADANILLPGARLVIPGADVDAAGRALPAMRPITTPPPPRQAPKVQTATPTRAPAPTMTSNAAPTTQPVAQGATTPDAAVRTFYGYVLQRQFEQAAKLWSPSMRSSYPPAENIDRRFGQTAALTLSRAEVVEVDTAAGRATVAVQLTEVVGPPTATRQYVGQWYVVRGPGGGWLLDKPALQLT